MTKARPAEINEAIANALADRDKALTERRVALADRNQWKESYKHARKRVIALSNQRNNLLEALKFARAYIAAGNAPCGAVLARIDPAIAKAEGS